MTFLVATCEFPDRADQADAMWQRLAAEFDKSPVDLLVLPELAGVDSFWTSPTFDEAVWRQAVAVHEGLKEHLRPIAAKRIVGTRAIADGGKRWNETFLWTPERGLVRLVRMNRRRPGLVAAQERDEDRIVGRELEAHQQ